MEESTDPTLATSDAGAGAGVSAGAGNGGGVGAAPAAPAGTTYVERSFLPKATLEKSTTAKLKLEKYYESFILQLNELDKRSVGQPRPPPARTRTT